MRNLKQVPLVVKKSCNYAFSIVTGISTLAGIWGYTIKDINENLKWWQCGLILIVFFTIVAIFSWIYLTLSRHMEYTSTINGRPIKIKKGNIFEEKGMKVIPFNERFDTKVDDIIISHDSLNGQMIDRYVDNIDDLNQIIESENIRNSKLKPIKKNGKNVFPLGRIIPYKEFLLLSFSHFNDENIAYIGTGEYEHLLINMWNEIRRTYAGKPIVMPLIGSGITTINGEQIKNYTELLRCILCTLRSSKFQAKQGITITVTEEILNNIDMNEIKEAF